MLKTRGNSLHPNTTFTRISSRGNLGANWWQKRKRRPCRVCQRCSNLRATKICLKSIRVRIIGAKHLRTTRSTELHLLSKPSRKSQFGRGTEVICKGRQANFWVVWTRLDSKKQCKKWASWTKKLCETALQNKEVASFRPLNQVWCVTISCTGRIWWKSTSHQSRKVSGQPQIRSTLAKSFSLLLKQQSQCHWIIRIRIGTTPRPQWLQTMRHANGQPLVRVVSIRRAAVERQPQTSKHSKAAAQMWIWIMCNNKHKHTQRRLIQEVSIRIRCRCMSNLGSTEAKCSTHDKLWTSITRSVSPLRRPVPTKMWLIRKDVEKVWVQWVPLTETRRERQRGPIISEARQVLPTTQMLIQTTLCTKVETKAIMLPRRVRVVEESLPSTKQQM